MRKNKTLFLIWAALVIANLVAAVCFGGSIERAMNGGPLLEVFLFGGAGALFLVGSFWLVSFQTAIGYNAELQRFNRAFRAEQSKPPPPPPEPKVVIEVPYELVTRANLGPLLLVMVAEILKRSPHSDEPFIIGVRETARSMAESMVSRDEWAVIVNHMPRLSSTLETMFAAAEAITRIRATIKRSSA